MERFSGVISEDGEGDDGRGVLQGSQSILTRGLTQ